MKAINRAGLMVAAFVLLLPLSARSEIKAGSFEVTPFVGYNFFEKSQNLKDRPVFGGRIGYNFTSHFGIEGVGEFIGSHVDDTTKAQVKEGQFGRPAESVDVMFYHLDLVYHFIPEGRVTPFVVAGIGGTHYSEKISTRDMAAFNAGLGMKVWLTDRIALRFDVQDYMVTEIMEETYHNVGATVGLTFAFGGEKKREPAPVARYEAKPEPAAVVKPEPRPAPPALMVEERVIILVAEPVPVVEEKVVAAVEATKVEEKIIVLAFEDVHFDFDRSTLKPEAQTILKRNVQLLKDNPKAKIRVAGYTSASGTQEYNQGLSERRANAVREYLVNEGVITRDRLSTIGYGETNPAMYEAAPKELYSPAAKANMRVLFEIIVQ